MTCIVGIASEGRVYIGGASCARDGWKRSRRADTKVFKRGPYLFGFTGTFRLGDLLCYSAKLPLPLPPRSGDLRGFMVTTFVDAVRDCLKEGGLATKTSEREGGGTFLVGVEGRLFKVETDYQMAEEHLHYDSVGGGYQTALGTLYVTEQLGWDPKTRIKWALRAAREFHGSVQEPFTVQSVKARWL